MARFLLALFLGLVPSTFTSWGADAPRRAPGYTIRLATGQQLQLDSYRGRVVLLMFVNTDCPHCADTCKLMEQIQKDAGPGGLQTLAVAFDQKALSEVPGFIRRTGVTFPVGYYNPVTVLNFLQRAPGLVYVPILVFIDRNGVIRGQYVGDDEFQKDQEKNIRALLEKLLKEPASQAPSNKR